MNTIEKRYMHSSYFAKHPNWDRKDSPWKADLVRAVLSDHEIHPSSLCEIGCGAGDVLVHLQRYYAQCRFYGYDISPQAAAFWKDHEQHGIAFRQGDYFKLRSETYDVLLMLDVIEHLRDPFTFLERLRDTSSHFVFLIPLDLSAMTVLRGGPLIDARSNEGHIHYYTKDLAIATLKDCGFEIIDWRYSGAGIRGPQRTLKTRLAVVPRLALYALHKDLGVRALGGETLVVLARPAP